MGKGEGALGDPLFWGGQTHSFLWGGDMGSHTLESVDIGTKEEQMEDEKVGSLTQGLPVRK